MCSETRADSGYEWIDPAEAADLTGGNFVLFGAGRGSEEFLQYLGLSNSEARILALADNDASFWGKTLAGYPIVAPVRLKKIPWDRVVVTSISGREAIANQLEEMGFAAGEDYICIGRYPCTHRLTYEILLDGLRSPENLQDQHCLHVGAGGFLGLEVLLYCAGAASVCSIDKFRFGAEFPNISARLEDYEQIKADIVSLQRQGRMGKNALKRYESLFIRKGSDTFLDTRKIDFRYPVDVCELPFAAERFDMLISFAVLEHVTAAREAVAQMARVLKPGSTTFHTIITQDHRSFSKVSGYTPFSFRSYSCAEWEQITVRKFQQNRLLPVEWKRLFEENGFKIEAYSVERRVDLDSATLESFHPDFKRFSKSDLGEINCRIRAVKTA